MPQAGQLIVAPKGMLLIASETRLTGHRGNAAEIAMQMRVGNEYGVRSRKWFGEPVLEHRNMANNSIDDLDITSNF